MHFETLKQKFGKTTKNVKKPIKVNHDQMQLLQYGFPQYVKIECLYLYAVYTGYSTNT